MISSPLLSLSFATFDCSKNSGESNEYTSPLNFDDSESNEYFNKYREGDMSGEPIYTGLSDICTKKKWANENKIVWDGISNYNSC